MEILDLSRLADPFPSRDIEWRLQQATETRKGIRGMALAYVTNRAIQARLDAVVGPTRWRNEFEKGPDGGVLCGISIYVDSALQWVTKWDGAENTDIEGTKGGLSGAMKRAAVQWGIGRYLYDLDAAWIGEDEDGDLRGKTKDGKWFNWSAPTLPDWALPLEERPKARPAREKKKTRRAEVVEDVRHSQLVEFIKTYGSQVPPYYDVDGVLLRESLRDAWGDIKINKDVAEQYAALISHALEILVP